MSEGLSPHSAMVLAAGLGTRMRPLTLHTPKPLVTVGGKALLTYVLDPLFKSSLNRIVINAHHLAGQIHDWVENLSAPSVVVSDESDCLMDSGGGIKKALPLLGSDPFYVLNADSFWIEKDSRTLERMAQMWDRTQMDLLLLLATHEQATGYDGAGDFTKDGQGRLSFRGDRPTAPFIYAGCALVKPELFASMPDDPFSLSVLFRQAAEKGRLSGLVLDGAWMHVGTVAAIAETEKHLHDLALRNKDQAVQQS
jgi:MurNAc alpha-1-phosphate uridylyltransferase